MKRIDEDLKSRALKAITKPPDYGPDLDIEPYLREELHMVQSTVQTLPEAIPRVGIDTRAPMAGIYYQVDNIVSAYRSFVSGLEIEPIDRAIDERWDEVKDFIWKLIPVDMDKFTALTFLRRVGGYFIRVKKNTRIELPIQTCFFISSIDVQAVHNIVVVEDGAEVTFITGCTVMPEKASLHIAVEEFFIGSRAKVASIKIHSWNMVTHVRMRSAVTLGDEAVFSNTYINVSKVKTLQTFPSLYARGNKSTVYSASIILAPEKTYIDVGTRAVLEGEESRAEIIMRGIARDEAYIVSRLYIDSKAPKTRGYIECNGLLLSEKARFETIPQLSASNRDSELYHEASIGRLRDEEVFYLMMKGLSYSEAVSTLIRGFIDVTPKYVPEKIQKIISSILDQYTYTKF